MTNFEKIKSMGAEELSKFLVDENRFPNSPCYICKYDRGPICVRPVLCDEEHRAKCYKEWLMKEV